MKAKATRGTKSPRKRNSDSKKHVKSKKNKQDDVSIKPVINSMGSYTVKLRELIRKKVSFQMVATSNYAYFKTKDHMVDYKYSRYGFDAKFLSLLNKVKADIKRSLKRPEIIDNLPDYDYKNVRYYCFGRTILDMAMDVNKVGDIQVVDEAREFDCTKAYIESAYKLGYLSEPIYMDCINADKSLRLKILGAIATRKEKTVFRNGKEISSKPLNTDTDVLMRKVWFHICKYLDNCMWQFKVALGEDFLMYWVDGIVFRSSALKKADAFAMYAHVKYGLTFKEIKVSKVSIEYIEDKRMNAFGKCMYIVKGKDRKRFMLPIGKQRSIRYLTKEKVREVNRATRVRNAGGIKRQPYT